MLFMAINSTQQANSPHVTLGGANEKNITIRIRTITDFILSLPRLLSGVTINDLIKRAAYPLTLAGKSLTAYALEQGLGSPEVTTVIEKTYREDLKAMGGNEVIFSMPGNPKLEGMFFEGNPLKKPNHKTILLCTGSHHSFEYYAVPMVQAFLDMGHRVMTFNYEGFGASEGEISEKNVYRSTEAAYQYLKEIKKCDDKSLIGWGYSLGSGAVTELATKHPINIVIDRGFSSMSTVAATEAPKLLKTAAKVLFITCAHFDNERKLQFVKGNIFIAQGDEDPMTEELHGHRLAAAGGKNAFYAKVSSAHANAETCWFAGNLLIKDFLER